jgi:AcrR family transcriptional regulator
MPSEELPDTGERLIQAAVRLFARKWYGTVSVAEICRAAGLSNGIFYRYFDNKEVLFRRILERVTTSIAGTIAAHRGADPRQGLREFVLALVAYAEEEKELVSVYREGQYRFFEYEQRLVEIYRKGLSQALRREVGLPEYLFALGGIRFCAIRRALHGTPADMEAIFTILEGGIFPGAGFDPDRVFGGTVNPLPIALEEKARERLLRAGKKLFGEKGYFETNIHEVTDQAGLSVGAFYTHFASKEAFYGEIIALVGHEVRLFISRNLGEGLSRLEFELRGLWLFLVHLSIDRNCYNIVREAEFVLPDAVRAYYAAFVDGYRGNPEGNGPIAARGGAAEETVIEFLLGIAHYFGIEVAFDESPANARSVVESIGRLLSTGLSPAAAPGTPQPAAARAS